MLQRFFGLHIPTTPSLSPLSLAVVGAGFPNTRGPDRRFEIALCAPGELIELRPEPRNRADPNAIAVFSCRGVQIGYVTAERAPLIGKRMRDGIEVIALFQEATRYGAVIRVGFDEMPALPEMRAAADDVEPDYWPDDLPPDD